MSAHTLPPISPGLLISRIYTQALLHLPRFCLRILFMTTARRNFRYHRPCLAHVIQAVGTIIINLLIVGVGVEQVPFTPA